MKRKITIGSVIVVVIVLAVLFVHPVKVLSNQDYKYKIFLTLTTTEVENFAPMSGGWRAYLNEEDYIWFSDGTYERAPDGTPFGVNWRWPWEKPILNMGVS